MNKLAREIAHSVVATDEVTSKYIGTDTENKLIHAFIASLQEQTVIFYPMDFYLKFFGIERKKTCSLFFSICFF